MLLAVLLAGIAIFLTSCSSSGWNFTSNSRVSAPMIASEPAGQSVTVGQPATFSVTATGTAPFTYQWFLNGTAAGTNSNTFTVAQATLGEQRRRQ
jgi:hypothetical protein